MSEANRDSEHSGQRLPPIWTIEEFDRLLEDETFVQQIAGFTTVSLSHVIRGVTDAGVQVKQYGRAHEDPHVTVRLANRVYETMFGRKTLAGEVDVPESIYENRKYGVKWAAREIVEQQAPKDHRIDPFHEDDVTAILQHISQYPGLSQLTWQSAVHDYMDKDQVTDQDDIADIWEAVHEYFPSDAGVVAAARAMRERRGVQVIYGAPDAFISYVKDRKHDEADSNSVVVYSDIPEALVLGLVPLGSYEDRGLQSLR